MNNSNIKNIRINGERLWNSLMDMSRFGATAKGGCNRQALTDEDKQGRDLFVEWCRDANCTVKVDQMGNIFAKRAGKNNELPVVLAGSHLDTQPTGGKFDGVYGVLAGLEVIRSLNDADIDTEYPVEVVCWTNEEGARFSPAMIGSGVWAGEFDLQFGHSRSDDDGRTIGDELSRIGYLGEEECSASNIKAAFEVHIEQGPILENENLQIGVLTGVQGMCWYDVIIEGQPCHAGPTPMDSRRDPFMGLHRILESLYEIADNYAPWSRVTFGDIKAEPGSRNTVPEKLILSLDMRHPEQDTLNEMDKKMRDIINKECEAYNLISEVRVEWNSPAIKFNNDCVTAVQGAVDLLGYSNMQMVSGAGHDSVYVSRVAPTSMIFIPCENGLSHNEEENAKFEDIEAGCNVLFHAMLNQAL
ncbi:MAG: Zn-dependent hydrolase [Halieaceae bacterium]|nr:Zn-dependent hydrolase [Halieaceae bacterium]